MGVLCRKLPLGTCCATNAMWGVKVKNVKKGKICNKSKLKFTLKRQKYEMKKIQCDHT